MLVEAQPITDGGRVKFYRSAHAAYLRRGLESLPRGYQGLFASQPWLCYWILNSLVRACPASPMGSPSDPCRTCWDSCQIQAAARRLMNPLIPFWHTAACLWSSTSSTTLFASFRVVQGGSCRWLVTYAIVLTAASAGGYGGGPKQLPHLAPSYAAVNALCVIGSKTALESIDREKVYNFLVDMKHDSGGFRMHDDGEVDIRASYCAVSVASILNILDDVLTKDLDKYIVSCQTYEGGLGGEPGAEAHGGYTFCGVAAASIIGCVGSLDTERLLVSSPRC